MSDLSVKFLLFKGEKYVQKSLNKIRLHSPMEKIRFYELNRKEHFDNNPQTNHSGSSEY